MPFPLPKWLRAWLTAAHLALVLAFIGDVSALIAGLTQLLPNQYANLGLAAVAMLAAAAKVIKLISAAVNVQVAHLKLQVEQLQHPQVASGEMRAEASHAARPHRGRTP